MLIGKFTDRHSLVATMLLAIFILGSHSLGWWTWLEFGGYDDWFRLRGPLPARPDIVIIEMDDASTRRIGRPPWPRSTHARLLEKLSPAKVVAFDLTFDAPTTQEEDRAFRQALERHGRVILASFFDFEKEGGEVLQVLRQPTPELLQAARGTGFINFPTEPDNVVRRAAPIDINTFDRPYPSLALAAGLVLQNLTVDAVKLTPEGFVSAGRARIPLDDQWQVLMDFPGPARTFTYIPYHKVLLDEVPVETFRDKIIFIGPTAAVDKDSFNTPFTRGNLVLDSALPTPGVELHATALASYLDNRYYRKAGRPVSFGLIAAVMALSFTLSAGQRPWRGLAYLVFLLLVYFALAGLSWSRLRIWVPVVTPLVAGILTFLVATVLNFIQAERQRRYIRGVFGRYVTPSVVDHLLAHPSLIELGGQRREVTVLFSDIRGFTSYSEGKRPEEVVTRLNEYLAVMTRIIFKHGGTLDKYLGDGLMAVFGVPLPKEDHASRALAASWEMVRALEKLNAAWKAKGEPVFDLGIGINSGEVVAGNIGSPERMEYTVIGEEVNLASRLESLNKEYGTRIILSERALAHMIRGGQTRENFLLLGEAPIRGLARPIGIYTVKAEDKSEEAESNAG